MSVSSQVLDVNACQLPTVLPRPSSARVSRFHLLLSSSALPSHCLHVLSLALPTLPFVHNVEHGEHREDIRTAGSYHAAALHLHLAHTSLTRDALLRNSLTNCHAAILPLCGLRCSGLSGLALGCANLANMNWRLSAGNRNLQQCQRRRGKLHGGHSNACA